MLLAPPCAASSSSSRSSSGSFPFHSSGGSFHGFSSSSLFSFPLGSSSLDNFLRGRQPMENRRPPTASLSGLEDSNKRGRSDSSPGSEYSESSKHSASSRPASLYLETPEYFPSPGFSLTDSPTSIGRGPSIPPINNLSTMLGMENVFPRFAGGFSNNGGEEKSTGTSTGFFSSANCLPFPMFTQGPTDSTGSRDSSGLFVPSFGDFRFSSISPQGKSAEGENLGKAGASGWNQAEIEKQVEAAVRQANSSTLSGLAEAKEISFARASELRGDEKFSSSSPAPSPSRRGRKKREKVKKLQTSRSSEDSPPVGAPLTFPLSCPFAGCGKIFLKPSALARHCRSHTGERPFECQFPGCGLKFAERGNLKRHEKAVHSREKPFECSSCGTKFARNCHLLQHQKAKHWKIQEENQNRQKKIKDEE